MDNLPDAVNTFVSKNMVRILIFLFTMMVGMIVGLNSAHAATKTPTPSPTSSPPAATAPVPIITGTVSAVSATTMTVKDTNGQSTTLTFSPTLRVEAPGITSIKGKPTVKNIAVNDTVAAVTADQTTTGVVVIASKTGSLPAAHQIFQGIVSSRDATVSGTILSLKSQKGDDFAKAEVLPTSKITAKGIDKPTVDDIKADDTVLVMGPQNTQNIIQITKVYLIPGKARGLLDHLMGSMSPFPVASSSASPAASATAAPKAVSTKKPAATP